MWECVCYIMVPLFFAWPTCMRRRIQPLFFLTSIFSTSAIFFPSTRSTLPVPKLEFNKSRLAGFSGLGYPCAARKNRPRFWCDWNSACCNSSYLQLHTEIKCGWLAKIGVKEIPVCKNWPSVSDEQIPGYLVSGTDPGITPPSLLLLGLTKPTPQVLFANC